MRGPNAYLDLGVSSVLGTCLQPKETALGLQTLPSVAPCPLALPLSCSGSAPQSFLNLQAGLINKMAWHLDSVSSNMVKER